MMRTVEDCRIVMLPRIQDPRGNLTFVEGGEHIPFEIRRMYWIYDVPGGHSRGGHAYRELHELIVAVSGSFDVTVHDGKSERTFSLNRSYFGVYVPNLLWRSLGNFSTNSLSVIMASDAYREGDYIRDFDDFIRIQSGE